ncbi:MAG: metallophosphoesterase [Candidatus Dormibacter sp.]
MAKSTRLYVVSDLHAAEGAWRKLLNAIKLNIYQADAVLLAGDLTGKAMVPIYQTDGGYEAELLGVRQKARGDTELPALQRAIADVGYYSFVTTVDEGKRLNDDPAARGALFHRLMSDRMEAWLTLANEHLAGVSTPLYIMPGNDDDFVIDPILDRDGWITINANEKVLDIPGGFQLASMGWSSPTPWHTPRELPEEEFLDKLSVLVAPIHDYQKAIFMTHVPPFDSGLDTAPMLDRTLRPTVSMGDVLRGPVGSTGVRSAIEKFKPLVGVHGHIHESGGHRKVGSTLCVNSGSEANHGILRGYLVDISGQGVERAIRVEG